MQVAVLRQAQNASVLDAECGRFVPGTHDSSATEPKLLIGINRYLNPGRKGQVTTKDLDQTATMHRLGRQSTTVTRIGLRTAQRP